jgi:hypothetical protein
VDKRNESMKMNIERDRLFGRLRTTLIATGALLLAGSSELVCHAQPDPTTVTWDCVMAGPRQGIAYLNFASDNTFTGFEILVPKARKSSSDDRGSGSRGDEDEPSVPGTQTFGAGPIEGVWSFDAKGRIIGHFIETSTLENCVTNAFAISTNGVGISDPNQYCVFTNGNTICYTNQVTCSAVTNQISFVGTVVTGQRLNFVCSTPFGKVSYRGVPAVVLTDLSGSWYGVKKQDNLSYIEFFSMTPTGIPNIYDVVGFGPGYTYSGNSALSVHRKFGFVVGIDPNSEVIRAVIGSFNARRMTSKTRGWEQPDGFFDNPIKFDVSRSAP